MCELLQYSLYGTRDAAHNWQEELASTLSERSQVDERDRVPVWQGCIKGEHIVATRMAMHEVRLECRVQGAHWRSGATTAEADDRSSESSNADPKRHDLGGRRSGSVGTAVLDDVHDLQGSTAEHRVCGG